MDIFSTRPPSGVILHLNFRCSGGVKCHAFKYCARFSYPEFKMEMGVNDVISRFANRADLLTASKPLSNLEGSGFLHMGI